MIKHMDLGERCPNGWRCQRTCLCHALKPDELEADLQRHYRIIAERVREIPTFGAPPLGYPRPMLPRTAQAYGEAWSHVTVAGHEPRGGS